MSVVAPSEPPRRDELEALIREARARQRRRRLFGAAVVAIVSAVGLSVHVSLHGRVEGSTHGRGGLTGVSSRCRTDQLRLSWLANGASAGESYVNMTLTNVSARACELRGWPTLGFVLRGGRRIAVGAHHDYNGTQKGRLPIRPVLLRRHAAASFNVRTADHHMFDAVPTCSRVQAALVTPPGSKTALQVRQPGVYCGRALLAVTPLVAGQRDHYWVVG